MQVTRNSSTISQRSRQESLHADYSSDPHYRHHGTSQELESLRIEYQNLFDRSNKLDNKAYITVTFCGFMFVFITSLFGSIPLIQLEGQLVHDALTILYISSCIAVSITYVVEPDLV